MSYPTCWFPGKNYEFCHGMIIVIIDIQLSFHTTDKLPHLSIMTNVVIFSTEIECKLAGIQQAAAGRCLVFAGTLILPERCFHFA